MTDIQEMPCDLWESLIVGLSITEGDPHYRCVMLICVGVSILAFVVSTVSNNMSQVDWLWSLLPVIYAWICVVDARTKLMAVLVVVWFVRIKHTFYRRYGWHFPPWNREEDYRWEWVKGGKYRPILTNKYAFMAFNLVFISLYQNVLLALFAGAPCLVAYSMATVCKDNGYQESLNWIDAVAATVFLFFVTLEGIADNQQYAFQSEKYRLIRDKAQQTGEYADGFCQSGLFAIVRKPNYAAEQCIWCSFYIFTIASGAPVANWSLSGAVLLVHLFIMSGKLTEEISQSKYPKYAEYMTQVPLYVPFTKRKVKED